jgi:hypothetical protein
MHHFIYFILIFVLLSLIHLGLSSNTIPDDPTGQELFYLDDKEEEDSSLLSSSSTSTTIEIESIVEDIVDNVTEPLTTTTTTTTAVINEKQFLKEV